MKIAAQDLHRMAYNAIQFSDKGSTIAGQTLWAVGEGMEVWASDDYVALRDYAPVIPTGDTSDFAFTMELKHLKDLEKELRDREGEISFELAELADDQRRLEFLSLSDFPVGNNVKDLTHLVKVIDSSVPGSSMTASPFAIRQDRFTKFRLLKTPGKTEYPVDCIQGYNDFGVGVLLWKLGPTLCGVVGQVDRDYLHEYFRGEEDVLWD